MIDNDLNIFLSDFGLAVRVPAGRTHRGRAGTPCYYPYEMVKGREYDHKADIWCMGVLLVEMLFAILPFKAKGTGAQRDYSESIMSLKFSLPYDSKNPVSNEARDLIKRMLVPEANRMSLEDL